MRRLLLISLDWGRPKDPPMSLGHASILTHMTRLGLDVIPGSWSVADPNFDMQNIIQFISENSNRYTDVGFGAFVWNEPYILKIISNLKSNEFSGRIILGGSQVSYTKANLESYYPDVDVFIRGYAEDALAQLFLSQELYPTIEGVHYAGKLDSGRSAVAQLTELVSPYLAGTLKPQRFLRWETQRGCPFRCAFCQHRESDLARKHRYVHTQRVLEEIDFFLEHDVIQDIAVLDPVFNTGKTYLDVLDRFAKGGYTGKLALQCRLEMVTNEFLDLVDTLNQTGTVVLEFGLQTTNPLEEKHIQRPNNMETVRRVLRETYQRKIQTEISLIFGLPEQTVESFRESIEFCKSAGVRTIYAYPLRLHRGTPLYDRKNELGLVESERDAHEHNGDIIAHVISGPSFTEDDWYEMAEIAKELDNFNASNDFKIAKTLKHTAWGTVIASD